VYLQVLLESEYFSDNLFECMNIKFQECALGHVHIMSAPINTTR